MNVKVKALDSFVHGSHNVTRDQQFKVTKPEAEELSKSGLVEMVESEKSADEPPRFADQKMDALPENKMADAPANKRGKKAAE